MENNAQNIFNTFAETQRQAVESFTNATQQMAKNMFSSDINSDFFKKWYDSQMAFFNGAKENKEAADAMNFFNTWMDSQVKLAQEWMKTNGITNPFMSDDMKRSFDNAGSIYQAWVNNMNAIGQMAKQFTNNEQGRTAFTGMFNNSEMYMKMFELWMPVLKSIQDKTYTPDMFKNAMNMFSYKEMMDKMFNFQPDFIRNMMNNDFMNAFKSNVNSSMDNGKQAYDQFKNMMWNNMPDTTGAFNNVFAMYSQAFDAMNTASVPMMKMLGNGAVKDQIDAAKYITNEFNVFMMKNTQLQYQVYITGIKAMEEVAENVYAKMRSGDDMTNFTNIYNEWLNISDKTFVNLFQSEEYSKMQGELNSFGMKLKRHMDQQMEKSMANMPVITRTEMDELYQTIHDLKKKISALEKQAGSAVAEEKTEEVKETKTARKTAKNA